MNALRGDSLDVEARAELVCGVDAGAHACGVVPGALDGIDAWRKLAYPVVG
ncbi:MAG: hypothetical protein IPK13_06695 [Deltaproteobacteria bacterium]|nr:hypothetical protein [Deltaproteobacteria bacterium]